MIEYLDVACPKCFGSGFLDDEIESPCDLCESGMVSKEVAEDFAREPRIPTQYWWTTDGLMREIDND